jgi:hypothetical protein
LPENRFANVGNIPSNDHRIVRLSHWKADTANSDIDLMAVGNGLIYSARYVGLQAAEKILSRPVNPNILDYAEWKKKRTDANSFIEKVLSQPKIFVFGSEVDL